MKGMLTRPASNEYAEYYGGYISKVPEGNILDILEKQIVETLRFVEGLGEDKASFRYAPGKWSIKQIVGHLSDTERVFQYRALAFARLDPTALPSFEQDDYVKNANFDAVPLRALLDEFSAVRSAGVAMFRSFDDDMFLRAGTASGFRFTVRAMPYIIAGHERHHMGVIRERYI
jgi:hypothetical protein